LRHRYLALALALALALSSACLYYGWSRWLRRGYIGVIRIRGYILSPSVAEAYSELAREAMANDSIKAVVLVIDSFGGYSDYVEQIYLDLKELARRKPLVALLVNALSGGYYIAVAADYIFVHPTSFVGAVGVIALAPPMLIPSEVVLETGPYKHTGFRRLLFFYNLSHALDAFIGAIEEGRGDRLRASRAELSRGLIYLGVEAVKLGLADEVGSLQRAIEEAAHRAGLISYEVIELQPRRYYGVRGYYSWGNLTLDKLEELHPPPSLYYIYLGAEGIVKSRVERPSMNITRIGGRVLVDLSHGNMISWWDLDALIAELAQLNVTVGFVDDWGRLEEELVNASCLIVASPTMPYGEEERARIREFVEDGGLLLLLFDPSFEYIGQRGLAAYVIAPINTLAAEFGIYFAKGFLYSEEEFYGIYRNIYVRDFANHSLFKGINAMVLFTTAPVKSRWGVAWAPNGTYSSAAEVPGRYAVMAVAEWGNGTVLAVGDITFLKEPYCHVADNYEFIVNLATLIANSTRRPLNVSKVEAERIEEPQIPVGTVKTYVERVNGEERLMKWIKVSETEVVVERPEGVTHYYYDEEGNLVGWEADGLKCAYEEPLPKPPYPLTRGKAWRYSTGYALVRGEEELKGELEGVERVEDFEVIKALDGKEYFCARVAVRIVDRIYLGGLNLTTIIEGHYWISSEVGTVKQYLTYTYHDGGIKVITRSLMLKSVSRGG